MARADGAELVAAFNDPTRSMFELYVRGLKVIGSIEPYAERTPREEELAPGVVRNTDRPRGGDRAWRSLAEGLIEERTADPD